MIGYVTLGARDKAVAIAFYDALLEEFAAKQMLSTERLTFWSAPDGGPLLGVGTPFNLEEASPGNGTMVALQASSKEQVDRLHARALELGASDEGAPGTRMDILYAAYVRDLDGNKLAFVCYLQS